MGFDLYGEGNFNKKPKIDWEESTEEEQKEYFEALDKFEKNNPGYYFRNNVWWWRPLWDYIYSIANDVLTEEDYERGQYNDYWLIDKNKALKLADKISEAISMYIVFNRKLNELFLLGDIIPKSITSILSPLNEIIPKPVLINPGSTPNIFI